jgi:hypothetical protein
VQQGGDCEDVRGIVRGHERADERLRAARVMQCGWRGAGESVWLGCLLLLWTAGGTCMPFASVLGAVGS